MPLERCIIHSYIISLICFFVEHISIWTSGQGYNLSLSLNEKRNWVWPDQSWFLHLKNFPLQILKFDTILLLPLIAAMRPALDLINWFPLQMWDQFFSANLWLLLHCALMHSGWFILKSWKYEKPTRIVKIRNCTERWKGKYKMQQIYALKATFEQQICANGATIPKFCSELQTSDENHFLQNSLW